MVEMQWNLWFVYVKQQQQNQFQQHWYGFALNSSRSKDIANLIENV